MKVCLTKVFIINLLLFFAACNKESFKVGDCIQNPDSIIVWKVKKVEGDNYTLFQNKDKRVPNLKTIKLDGIWTKSNCPNP